MGERVEELRKLKDETIAGKKEWQEKQRELEDKLSFFRQN
jgi:hypothetical protein